MAVLFRVITVIVATPANIIAEPFTLEKRWRGLMEAGRGCGDRAKYNKPWGVGATKTSLCDKPS